MRVRTLFFAAYRDALGAPELEVDLPDGSSVDDLVAELQGRGRPFTFLGGLPAIAVNRSVVPPDTRLAHGDEVAFLPPVAGG